MGCQHLNGLHSFSLIAFLACTLDFILAMNFIVSRVFRRSAFYIINYAISSGNISRHHIFISFVTFVVSYLTSYSEAVVKHHPQAQVFGFYVMACTVIALFCISNICTSLAGNRSRCKIKDNNLYVRFFPLCFCRWPVLPFWPSKLASVHGCACYRSATQQVLDFQLQVWRHYWSMVGLIMVRIMKTKRWG